MQRPYLSLFNLLVLLPGVLSAAEEAKPVQLHGPEPATEFCRMLSSHHTPASEADRSGRFITPPGYVLVWGDEFNEDGQPDPKKWTYEQGFVRNKELQWYQPQNAIVRDGRLIIEGRRERIKNPHYDARSDDWKKNRPYAEYSSAALITNGRFAAQYGIFEIRARFAPAEGMWPAFWTLGIEEIWPSSGEIDIMEYYKGKFLANLMWASDQKFRPISDSKTYSVKKLLEEDPDFATTYHTYTMEWDANTISLYLDKRLINRVDIRSVENKLYRSVKNPFRQPHYILLNLALGATGGSPENLNFPQQYEVDYIRVFQKKDQIHILNGSPKVQP